MKKFLSNSSCVLIFKCDFHFLFHCVAKFKNRRNDDKTSRWDDSRSSSWSKYANLRFVHLFILCCFFQGFYHQLILFFLFYSVAKFTNSRNDDKSSRWDDSRSSSWSKYANLRFVHLFILCCFFQGFYHQLIFFFIV